MEKDLDFDAIIRFLKSELIYVMKNKRQHEKFLEDLIKRTYNLKLAVCLGFGFHEDKNSLCVYMYNWDNWQVYKCKGYRLGIEFENEDQFLACIMKDFLFC
jgi:phage terminase large subunit